MTDHTPKADSTQLREMLSVLKRRRWTIAIVTTVVVTMALGFSFRQTPIYRSESQVLVTGLDLNPLQPGASQSPNLETEVRLGGSLSVAELVAEELGDVGTRELLENVTVQSPRLTEILVFSYQHPDPLTAQRRSQAFSEAYLEFRRSQALDELLATSASVQQRIDALNDDLVRLNRELAQGVPPAREPVLQAQVDATVSQITALQQQISELTPPEELRTGQIVEAANLPSRPASPNHLISGGLALFLGIALGIAVAFLRERLDDRLRSRDDLERRAGAPVLGVVPRISSWRDQADPRLVTLEEPTSVASEAYRTLRTSLVFAASQDDLKTVLVVGARPQDGKTTTVANLGVVLANAGKRVVVLSADLRRPRLHLFFGLPNDVGLTSVLSGETEMLEAVHRPESVAGLGVLTSGPIPGNPAELLGSEAMEKLLWRLREIADLVLIDSAPILAVADASILAPLADAVLLVADAAETSPGAVARARQQLDQMRARVVGAVLNNYEPSRDPARPEYHYYYAYEGDGQTRVPEEEPRRTTGR